MKIGQWREKSDGDEGLIFHEIIAEFGYECYVIPCTLISCVKTQEFVTEIRGESQAMKWGKTQL